MLSEVNRICEVFDGLRERGRAAVMPFLTAGDPDLETTAALLPAIERAGASVCEIGIPFSDPIADGPVIQASMTRALDRGVRPGEVLDAVADLRAKVDLGLIAMVSYSIVYRRGWTQFLKAAKAAGIDGFIFPDLPVEESSDVIKAVADLDMVCSMLVSPTTPLLGLIETLVTSGSVLSTVAVALSVALPPSSSVAVTVQVSVSPGSSLLVIV